MTIAELRRRRWTAPSENAKERQSQKSGHKPRRDIGTVRRKASSGTFWRVRKMGGASPWKADEAPRDCPPVPRRDVRP